MNLCKVLNFFSDANFKINLFFRYGKSPSEDEMKTSGGFCPICQDSFQVSQMIFAKYA